MIVFELSVTALFGALGPNGFGISKSILYFYFSAFLISITDYISASV